MFDQILSMVKDQLNADPKVKAAIPPGQEDAVHTEIANQVTNGIAQNASQQGIGGMLSQLQSGLTSNNPLVNAIEGGLVSSLGSKFGLPPMVTGAIAAALPGLLQKFAHKANDPNDSSITPDSISNSLSSLGGGLLGNLFGKH